MNRTAASLAIIGLVAAVGCEQRPKDSRPLVGGFPRTGEFHCHCEGNIQSIEDKTREWVNREIHVGMPRDEARIILKAHGLPIYQDHAGVLATHLVTKECVDGSGLDVLLGIGIMFDRDDRVTEMNVSILTPYGYFGEPPRASVLHNGNRESTVSEHFEKGVGLVVEHNSDGDISSQAEAEAWIRTEIPVGTARSKAIDALKKCGFFMGVLREPSRFSTLKITRPGHRVYMVIVVDLDVGARVTKAKAYLLDADDSFGQGPFSTMPIGNTP